MKINLPFHGQYSVFYSLETPVFFTPSHYTATCILLCITLAPLYALLAGFFGLKIFVLLGIACTCGFLTEFFATLVTRRFTGYYGFSVWILLPLLTPPGMEIWMAVVCYVLALIVTVVFFGGFGHHMFHPAVAAQIFIMINFAVPFAAGFLKPFIVPGYGFSVFSALLRTRDTTLSLLKKGTDLPILRTLFGPNTGFYADAFPLVVIVVGVIFLLLGGVNRKTPIAFLLTSVAMAFGAWIIAPDLFPDPVSALLAGGLLFYAFFIFSDRWTSAKSTTGRIIAGVAAAALCFLMRAFSSNIESIMFAALATAVFTPLFDEFGFALKRRRVRS